MRTPPWPLLVEAGFAGWLTATLYSQHPNRVFDGVRRFDPSGLLLPDWRFFAPRPAAHDFHVLYRTLTADGAQSAWRPAFRIAKRRWRHTLWNPTMRVYKTLFDICSGIAAVPPDRAELPRTPEYRLLRDFVGRHLEQDANSSDVAGFQFVVVQYSGYAPGEPQYLFVSPYEDFGGWSRRL
ncbi:hypothetical protein [Streptomyces wuyuanensis]|uniref:hypothetical protein n=1 Tax=Streptomyces wuyuanensis TaxID=1196353 RepID=UPI00343EC40A